jgi:hypothetical protein
MTRRATAHDYSRPGTYHITLHVAEGWDSILGTVVGDPMAADGTPEAPRVGLSPVGQMVEHELLTAIHTRYPMVYVQDHIVMPDHLHALVRVTEPLVSASGKSTHLGQVIAGFKKGCNKRYWEIIGNGDGETASHTVTDGSPVGTYKVPSNASSGRPPLFALGYCDVMPVDAAQLETQRAYIQGNPRSRLLRLSRRDLLTTQRGAIATALTPAALTGYLRRECAASQATPEVLAAIADQLLTRPTRPAGQEIVCDSYGDRALLQRRLLPVICHRRDKARFAEQKRRCLEEAQDGTVLVSPRIAKGEQEIIDAAVAGGYPVALVEDNGFPERYHPSAVRLDQCAADQLLLVTPWQYQYRGKNEQVTIPFCKAMNCVAQALCRQKDDWWKNRE